MAIALFTNSKFAAAHPGQPDVENPGVVFESHERLIQAESALVEYAKASGLVLEQFEAPIADWSEVSLVHSQRYIDEFRRACEASSREVDGKLLFGEEATLSVGTEKAALSAVGAGLAALKQVLSGASSHAICLVRPAGHHAEPESAMGFCFFSNVAVVAVYAEQHFKQRVSVIDFDVHRGNGTAAALSNRNNIQLIDIFITGKNEYPYQPKDSSQIDLTQNGSNILRYALPFGTTGTEYLKVFNEQALPALREFNPSLVIFSAGFDSLDMDPLGGFEVRPKELFTLVKNALSLNTPSIAMLEGGYDVEHLKIGLLAYLMAVNSK